MPLSSKKRIVELCRELRRNNTKAEDLLWQSVRNRKLSGFKFNRQHPLVYQSINGSHFFFIADFYCHEKQLVVELDGSAHNGREEYDANRDLVLRGLGISTLRFSNEQVETDLKKVLSEINSYCSRS